MKIDDNVVVAADGTTACAHCSATPGTAAQGIGRAYARRLVAEGCQVIMADRAHDRVEEAAAQLAPESPAGGAAVPRHLDVADERSCQALADEVMDAYGRLDGLVNNAAI